MAAHTCLRIATRIHFALLRLLGEGIDVSAMLRKESEAREILWVCEACGDAELMTLARQYRRAYALKVAAPGGHAQQATPWAGATTGFGLTQPPETGDAEVKRRDPASLPAWLKPASWLRRRAAVKPEAIMAPPSSAVRRPR